MFVSFFFVPPGALLLWFGISTRINSVSLYNIQGVIFLIFSHLIADESLRKNISRVNFSRFIIRDKNDIPILAGAVNESAVLVTEDALLKIDAQKYIATVSPSEALKKLRSVGNKKEA